MQTTRVQTDKFSNPAANLTEAAFPRVLQNAGPCAGYRGGMKAEQAWVLGSKSLSRVGRGGCPVTKKLRGRTRHSRNLLAAAPTPLTKPAGRRRTPRARPWTPGRVVRELVSSSRLLTPPQPHRRVRVACHMLPLTQFPC